MKLNYIKLTIPITYIRNLRFNGNLDEVSTPDLTGYTIEDGIPYTCNFIFTKYSTEIIFNDKEMLEVMGRCKNTSPNMPIDIVIKPTFMYNDMKISVQCGNKVTPLSKYKVVGVWGV